MWSSLYADDIVLVADSGMELQTCVGGGSSVCDEVEDEVQQ